jgi:hypothetical protein
MRTEQLKKSSTVRKKQRRNFGRRVKKFAKAGTKRSVDTTPGPLSSSTATGGRAIYAVAAWLRRKTSNLWGNAVQGVISPFEAVARSPTRYSMLYSFVCVG